MTDDQVFAVIASPLLIIAGVCSVMFRKPFTSAAQHHRRVRGRLHSVQC